MQEEFHWTRIYFKKQKRFDLGNPPGKNKSYGDAINWETLLQAVPDNQELIFISDDSDYYSEINSEFFNPFLLNEWQRKKHSTVRHFRNLTSFFRENFPEIKLANELEKNLLIEQLASSNTFAFTHIVLAKLNDINDFTRKQINDIILACINNNQIYWIAKDQDINDKISKIVTKHLDLIDSELFDQFVDIYGDNEIDEGINPFEQ